MQNTTPKESVCPKCGAKMKDFNLGRKCVDTRCTFWVPREIRQKVLSEEIIAELLEQRETRVVHGFHKRGNAQTFSARLYLSDAWKIKLRLENKTGLPCPACGRELLRFARGYRCMDEGNCAYVLWDRFGGKELTDEQMIRLLTLKTTEIIHGFTSRKNGKRYSARIVMQDSGRLKVEFEDGKKV